MMARAALPPLRVLCRLEHRRRYLTRPLMPTRCPACRKTWATGKPGNLRIRRRKRLPTTFRSISFSSPMLRRSLNYPPETRFVLPCRNLMPEVKKGVFLQRQMLQWITALERAAATSHYTGSNRFDSFAPIRLNVAAQWLVDGVCLVSC